MTLTNRASLRPIVAAVALTITLTIGVSACVPTNDESTPTPTPSASADAPPSVTDIIDTPGSGEGLVGALADSEVTDCALTDGAWKVDGKVTNPTEGVASYRIYVSLLDASSETRALQQVNVDAVAAAATVDWSAVVPVADEGLSCVLRVERYPA